jgi:hypothetical protein
MLVHMRKLVAILAMLASVIGLFRPDVYRDAEIIRAAWRPNDAVTPLVAVPLFWWSSQRARDGSVRAKLVELRVLHYFLYDFAFYLFGATLNVLFPLYAATVALAFWAIVLAIRELDLTPELLRVVAAIDSTMMVSFSSPARCSCAAIALGESSLRLQWV